MAAQTGKKGGAKRLVVAAAALAVLVAVGIGLAIVSMSQANAPDYGAGMAVEVEPTRPQAPKPKADEAAEDAPAPQEEAEEPARDLAVPSTAGALQVQGSQLVDAAGNPVQLRGVSTHGLAWFPQYVNQPLFTELRQDWGANVVRLAMYSAESGGYATADGKRSALRDLVMQGVEYATAADMYVVVDWHSLSDANPWTNEWAASDFFAIVSRDLADRSNVIYEICNEPNGDTTWADIKSYAETVIPVIRANDPDAVIIVGTPTWSQDVEAAAADPLAFDNVMYAMHFYAATHQDDLRNRLRTVVEGGLPVFVSEFGICEATGDGEIDYDSADAWVRLMDELNVSYICWNLSNKNEAAALFKSDVGKTSGFSLDDLTDEGLWLVDTLRGPGFDRKEVQLARADKKPNAQGSAMMAFAEGTIQWQLDIAETWEQDGRTFFKYEMLGNNYGAGVESWAVTIPFSADVTLEDSWNCKASTTGNELTLTSDANSGKVAAGAYVRDVGFIVSGPANLAVVDL
ncbi:cellulase family glycosylhydrolase [Adlercreutzia sp. R7]|uniref:Endoglucanase n=1 Tax=Adlercreutzia wanghongyangiae TaxID=3111451 RepID=A0ABU6IJ89_9ACTN|nr:cellulase family glycosylhydrolase [Adlercreutzia sp. R7]